ncbi:MAG: hypothetical protein WC631_02730 [Candidatus Paceibacterota bacterium]|jgi:hypothetical protein
MKKLILLVVMGICSLVVFTGCNSDGDRERDNPEYYNSYRHSAPVSVDIDNQSGYVCGVFKGKAEYLLYQPGDRIPLNDYQVFDGENITITVWWLEDQGGQLVKVHEEFAVVDNSYQVYKLVISDGLYLYH